MNSQFAEVGHSDSFGRFQVHGNNAMEVVIVWLKKLLTNVPFDIQMTRGAKKDSC